VSYHIEFNPLNNLYDPEECRLKLLSFGLPVRHDLFLCTVMPQQTQMRIVKKGKKKQILSL
jgi:hypothetical protein